MKGNDTEEVALEIAVVERVGDVRDIANIFMMEKATRAAIKEYSNTKATGDKTESILPWRGYPSLEDLYDTRNRHAAALLHEELKEAERDFQGVISSKEIFYIQKQRLDTFKRKIDALSLRRSSDESKNLPPITPGERAYLNLPPPQYARIQEVTVSDEAVLQANLLEELYGIKIEILETDQEYYSDEQFVRTIQDKVYFVSRENPIVTSEITEVLIRQAKLRVELMHANRVEKSAQKSLNLAEKINEIKREFRISHDGREPSLGKIANILNETQIDSPRAGSKWHAETVKRILDRTDSAVAHK